MASLDVDRIDEALEADGVLAGWLWAFDTPLGLEPRHVWSMVYPDPPTPVWMWIRSPETTVVVEAEWGLYRFEADVELGENGLLVTVGASIAETPVVVHLSTPGWVDFGRGDVPADVPGAPELDPVPLMEPSSATGDFSQILTSNIKKRFAESPLPEVAELGPGVRRPVESLVDATPHFQTRGDGNCGTWPPTSDGVVSAARSRFTVLREARGLSLAEASQRLAESTDTVASKDTLRRFEADIGLPHDRLLPVALDHALGAVGHLTVAETATGTGSGTARVPGYWSGPTWIEFWTETDDENTTTDSVAGSAGRIADLSWGNWRRSIVGQLPLLVICHASMAPLRIAADPAIHWTVGVGRRVGAIPINHGWLPDSIDTTQDALTDYQRALLQALRHAEEHLDGEALDQQDPNRRQ
jgi:hypothetical protein